ncbi:MAG: hypothetical protein HYY62_02500 [Deltaproteobacteria bacterium]|nr:hypothetical protein [Deltaproteobacteria bacterium]
MKKQISLLGLVLLCTFMFAAPISAEQDSGKDVSNPAEISGHWFGFYKDTATDEFSIYDIIFYPQGKNHVVAYWKLVDENGVPYNKGVVEGDITENGLTLFELDSSPIRYLYIRVLSSGTTPTLLGLSQQEGPDKKVSTLGYFMVFKSNEE